MTPEQRKAKDAREAAGLQELWDEYGDRWPEYLQMIESYEALEDPEARFVKSFDKLDPGFTHFSNNGIQLRTFYGYTSEQFQQAIEDGNRSMLPYAKDFPTIREDRTTLTQRIVDVTYQNQKAA